MKRMHRQRGVAIPMALLVMIVLTLLVAVGFAAASSEARMNANQDASVDVFTLAETGLELFMAKRDSFGFVAAPPAASESTRVTLTGGYADVVLTRVRNSAAAQRYGYIIRSHGVSTVATLSGTARGERTVAEYASWQVGTMKVLSGWTSLTGLNKNGAAGTLSGDDGCAASPQPPVAGVSVPTNPGYTGSTAPVSGNPPIQNLGTTAQAVAATKIDWDGIVNHGAITPDITIPPGSWPASFPSTYWPVIKLVGDWSLPGPGQGTLIVTGNMTISGSNMWNGVILAGGNLTSNGNNTVEGAVVSGLNVALGATLPQGSVGNGTKTYQYNSCNVASAMAKMAQLVGYTNAWVDNWPTY
jgi:Tfp pilus assembly protein PilX